MFLLDLIVLGALVKLNMELDEPWFPAGIYGFVQFVFAMFGPPGFFLSLGYGLLMAGAAAAYFALLQKFEGGAWAATAGVGAVLFAIF